MRTIKFRAQDIASNKWLFGDIRHHKNDVCIFEQGGNKGEQVKPETVSQFTGLHDKHGKEIYEGDIVEFYEMQSYCINPDCEPHIRGYGSRIYKYVRAVRFEDCSFGVDNGFIFTTLSCCGFLKDNEVIDEMKNDPYFDANGYDLDSIEGIEVIGNIHDDPDLIEKGGEK